MNTFGRLFTISPCMMMPYACISCSAGWPADPGAKIRVNYAPRKKWPDFLGHTGPGSMAVISGRVLADMLDAGLADGEFMPLVIEKAPIPYFAFRPRATIRMRDVDITTKVNASEPVSAWAPDYEIYRGHAFVVGRMAGVAILCIPKILALAKAKKWSGVNIYGFAGGRDLYTCDDQGKIIDDNPEPPTSIVDGYYVPQEVIAADLIRACELAAELQNSPDTPEWTRRSFEIVRKALIEAPHTLGYPLPESATPRRITKPGAPLIAPKALKNLKLEGEGELEGEIELGRPLFGSDTLSVCVSDSIFDDDDPEVSFTKAEMKRRAKAVLEKLESRLPALDAAIDAKAAAYEKSPADFRASLHDPRLLLITADMAKGELWTFVVEGDRVGHHFEFDGDKVITTWAGD